MAETHVISALTKKRSEMLGDIKHYESIIKSLKDDLTTIDKTIHIFDENYNLSSIKAVNTNRNRYFESGEATKTLLDVLRTANKAMLMPDVMDKAINTLDMVLNDTDIRAVKKSLQTTLNSLLKKGLVCKEGNGSTSAWCIANLRS